ncbi:MAG: hydantoinase B/oxoprolinase family protein [Anaerolineales bacterium]|nr:hydantoinase B/oxoprolinase family protein [Anaerolineales bacterium]
MSTPSPASLEIFKHLFASIAEEMGVTLGRTAFSPNIKERLDFSCAVFTGAGQLLAQALHIPVHLGAMPASVQAALARCAPFTPGDVVALNDPYLGGTHLPDLTLVSPVFAPDAPPGSLPLFFVASRAHHADIGGMAPGSMPLSTEIYQEGLIIPPIKLVEAARRNEAVWALILNNVRTPDERSGDLAAQLAAHAVGARRALEIVERYGWKAVQAHAAALLGYAEHVARRVIAAIPPGRYSAEDYLEPADPQAELIPLRVTVSVSDDTLTADFTGTAPADGGNLNAVRAIVESALGYVLRCLAGPGLPLNAGAFAPLAVTLTPGSLLDARRPSAVAAGNVETSQRLVDVLFRALAPALPGLVPAAGQGTMNNVTFGGRDPATGRPFAYYETMGGGAGAGPGRPGASGVHVHMSNTRNTPVEALEYAYPLRVERYALRAGSGGQGLHRGGEGLQRDLRFLAPVRVTVLAERRRLAPWGLQGGGPGAPGENVVEIDNTATALPAKFTLDLPAGALLSVRSPGGGGWGRKEHALQREEHAPGPAEVETA